MKALRADLEKAISPDALKDLTSASLAKFKTGIELANKFLKGSQWHLPDTVIEEYILDAIGAKGAALGANMRVQIGMQRHTGQTISLIMRKRLIAISNSATISSEELIAELHNVWSYENTTMRRANSDY